MKVYKNTEGKERNIVISKTQTVKISAGLNKLTDEVYEKINKILPNLLVEHKEESKQIIKEPVEKKKELVEKKEIKNVIKEPVESEKEIIEKVEVKNVLKEEKNGEKEKKETKKKASKKSTKTKKSKRGRKPKASKKDK